MRLRKDAKVELIRRVPLFSRCSSRQLQEIASRVDEVDLPPGKELIREGERGREFFILVDGTADVRKKGRKVDTVGDGDFVGEIALVSRVPRTATVVTTSDVHALVLTGQQFASVLRDSPDIQTRVMEALADRLAPEAV